MIEIARKPDITYTGEGGRTVEIYGMPSTEMFAKVFKWLIDKRLEEQAKEIAAKSRETEDKNNERRKY